MLLATLLCLLAALVGSVALAGSAAWFPAWLLLLEQRRDLVSDYQIQPIDSLARPAFVAACSACCLHVQRHPGFPLKIALG